MKEKLFNYIENNYKEIEELAKKIWENPEIAFGEELATKLQIDLLDDEDVKIVKNIGNMETAFYAEFGNGYPIIGILGEYDALPNLSQKCSSIKEEANEGGLGHACGHNLLGSAGVGAFIALKKAMIEENISGTIRYYGCPAEEVYAGKSFMAREGVFNDLDCVLAWHPHFINGSVNSGTTAFTTIEFNFKGTPAHAATAPHVGRSALDAVEIMNVGSNYLREHVIDQARIHYIITNGGDAVNIVPERASVVYGIRAPKKEQVDSIIERVIKNAKGAAMMTETSVEYKIKNIYYDTLVNENLNNLILENMKLVSKVDYNEEELKYIKEISSTINSENIQELIRTFGLDKNDICENVYTGVSPIGRKGFSIPGSTDVGDVSYIAPTGQFVAVCSPFAVDAHTWQATSSYGSSIGLKGMKVATKTFAGSIIDLLTSKIGIIECAKSEFDEDTKGAEYVAIPDYIVPGIK